MADKSSFRGTGIGGSMQPRQVPTPQIQQRPGKDLGMKSKESKNKLFGPQYEDRKHQGASKVWNQNRPLAKGGRRGESTR